MNSVDKSKLSNKETVHGTCVIVTTKDNSEYHAFHGVRPIQMGNHFFNRYE